MRPLCAILALLAPLAAVAEQPYFPPSDAQGGWRTRTTGVDISKLDAAFDYTETTSQHGGLLVVRHGWLVYEKYFGRGDREATPELASCGKAFTSIALGIMLKEKHDLIPDGLDTKVFTPKYMPPEAFPLNDPRKADIKLGQLLAMSAGIRGTSPGYQHGEKVVIDPPAKDGPIATTDPVAFKATLWCDPGAGYSYATSSPHLASVVLRKLTGMEMQDYMEEKLAKPMQWGRWGYAMHRPNLAMDHTPGGGSIAMRSTDVLRFAYLLLHDGNWAGRQLVPAEYVHLCGRPSPYNTHYPYSLQFEVNADGHVAGAPRDAFWKSGAGGYAIYVVPSLDMVIYKMGGSEGQYDPKLTDLPVRYKYDGSRQDWKPLGTSTDGGVRKLLEMVSAAVE